MRTFEKSHKLDYVCYDIRGPVMDEAQRMSCTGNGDSEAEYRKSCTIWFSYTG